MTDPRPPVGGLNAPPLTREDAVQIAVAAANVAAPRHDFVARPEDAVEWVFGWVVHVAPRKFVEDQDRGALVPGIGAVAVDRRTRTATLLRSSVHPDTAAQEFETQWKRRGGR